jgi:23S rRNA-/tRNA-specific pseudouridylate synthase
VTHYRVISNIKYQKSKIPEDLSLVELSPKTGRTHQIRVHLQYIKHPIFADPLYAGRKTGRNDRKLLPRIFLHASKIFFFHPKTNELINFESALPKELRQFLPKNLDFGA